jgi:hypothetical protein
MQSESISELAAALVAFQGEMGAVPKGSVNPFFKSRYADLADVKREASPVAWKHGLAVTQFPTTVDGEPGLLSTLVHSSGQWKEESAKLLAKPDPQGQGSGLTYMKRYAYCAILGIVADEDDDGNSAQPPVREAGEYRNNVQQQVARPTDSSTFSTGEGYVHGSGNANFDKILQAATISDNEFINDIAHKIETKGSLTDPQLESGLRAAKKILGYA